MTPEEWRRLSKRERRNWLLEHAGKRSNRWIARRIGCTPRQVWDRCNHYGIAPTVCQGCVTAAQAALVLRCSARHAAALCRSGRLRAHRNRQRRHWDYPIRRRLNGWWQIKLEDLAAYAGLPVGEVVRRLTGALD